MSNCTPPGTPVCATCVSLPCSCACAVSFVNRGDRNRWLRSRLRTRSTSSSRGPLTRSRILTSRSGVIDRLDAGHLYSGRKHAFQVHHHRGPTEALARKQRIQKLRAIQHRPVLRLVHPRLVGLPLVLQRPRSAPSAHPSVPAPPVPSHSSRASQTPAPPPAAPARPSPAAAAQTMAAVRQTGGSRD